MTEHHKSMPSLWRLYKRLHKSKRAVECIPRSNVPKLLLPYSIVIGWTLIDACIMSVIQLAHALDMLNKSPILTFLILRCTLATRSRQNFISHHVMISTTNGVMIVFWRMIVVRTPYA